MKKIFKFLFSMPLMAIALVIYAVAMGVATFMERDYGAPVARYIVYNAWWFELIQLILAINFIGNIFKYKLYKTAKLSILIFHFAFVVILLGAAITRYFSFEGSMNIAEGETSKTFLSEKSFISISDAKNKDTNLVHEELFISPYLKIPYTKKFNVNSKEFELNLKQVLPNAQKTFVDDPAGQAYIELIIAAKGGMETYYLQHQAHVTFQGMPFWLNVDDKDSANHFFIENNKVYVETPYTVNKISMQSGDTVVLPAGVRNELTVKQLYSIGKVQFVVKNFSEHAKLTYVAGDWANGVEYNVLVFDLKSGDKSKEIFVPSVDKAKGEWVTARLEDNEFAISHGSSEVSLPFEIKLNDFKLERYPGSESPSSYSSDVTLIDNEQKVNKDFKIYMNHILSHRGYRFYQSSYSTDEKATILSVNHDRAGTIITYIGYFLLALGMFWSIFNKNSHFIELLKKTSEIRMKRKGLGAAAVLYFLLVPQFGKSQTVDTIRYFDKEHSAIFGKLLMQDHGGRIKPFNTLSSELLRKIARKESFEGLDHNQVFLSMIFNPMHWQDVKIIKVSSPELKKFIGTDEKFVSFNQLVDSKKGEYKLKEEITKAFEKQPAQRGTYEKDVIAVDERLNLLYEIIAGEFLTVFPDSSDVSIKWVKPTEGGKIKDKASAHFAMQVFTDYYNAVLEAQKTKNWSKATEILTSIINYQKTHAKAIIPSDTKINLEVQYVNRDIFNSVYKYYGTLGFLLLIVLFVAILRPKTKTRIPVLVGAVILGLLFLYHTYGLAVRWYVSGHAPWSNGYESMIYIAWATMLAGFIFAKRSPIALAATALLSSITLMVAHLSWMDPEMTNLVPVLKSYWLTIHVSVITASYGFLGLGALLGFLSLVLMMFKNKSNAERIELTISELTNVNHMTLILGLYLLTIGTFLGGVWANESWGRYWGWDPKETWALITVIVYSFIIHTRFIPALNNKFAFNLMALLGYTSVMMTYFGVNYLLSGLHSYAKGDPAPIPNYVYYIYAVIFVVSVAAYIKDIAVNKQLKASQG